MGMSFKEAQRSLCEKNMLHSRTSEEMDQDEWLENEIVGSKLDLVKMGCVWGWGWVGGLSIVLLLLMFLSAPCVL